MLTCYCIESEGRTYVGATNDFKRRLRQHNGEIHGGAKSTHGRQWSPAIHVQGFEDRHALLRFEWMWKHAIKTGDYGMYRRIYCLEELLKRDEWRDLQVSSRIEWAPYINIPLNELTCSL